MSPRDTSVFTGGHVTCQRSAWMKCKYAKHAFIVLCIAGLHFKIYIVTKLKRLHL